ncbi:S-adenosyl-L-methionine-dependent methyltransferase [Xylaria acuta]|nr:S-adenosyl-L-methionine-dependent methyltransferase [Xylaria acuta]
MAQNNPSDNYKQGYSNYTTATHEKRTAESSAAFLIPHIKAGDHILDVGCGPGTITTGFVKYAHQGVVIGLDMSADVLEKARRLADDAAVPTGGPGSVRFEQGNILQGLPYADDTFDVVYCSQVLGHMPPPDLPRQALVEMRRVLKPGGILASRDGLSSFFYPTGLHLDRLWSQNLRKVLRQGAPDDVEDTSASLPAFYRGAGFGVDGGGEVRTGAGTMVVSDPETRRFFAWRTAGQLKPGDPFYQSWLEAGITKEDIEETLRAVNKWAETEDAWFAAMQCEMLAWK